MTEAVLEADDIVQFLGQGAGRVQALKGVSLSLKSLGTKKGPAKVGPFRGHGMSRWCG